ncbi:AMP-binding protein [Amycolatopsis sp. WAC 01375]|uniref:AMP-binding protein n=1 Tax=Amycolatopsis sp. WAC 01375 TaxID=2203194 RepID=UPI0018F78575|nr:AMP-binding protein [Amycolatopsis sp. WAC 01375]
MRIQPNPTCPGELVHHLLDAAVSESPDVPAITDATGTWSYRELDAHSHAIAVWLRARGVRPGDRVVARLATTRHLVALFFGVLRCGAVFVPLNPAMKLFHLTTVLANAEPAVVLVPADAVAGLPDPARACAAEEMWAEVESLVGRRVPDADIAPAAVAALVYTSGSTATPKAVILPHAQVVFASRTLAVELGYRDSDVVFCRFPLSWDYGLNKVLMTCAVRCEIVLAGEESDLALLRRMRETRATVVPIVPSLGTMIATLARRETDLPPVRLITNTGAALPAATIDALRECFPGVRVVRQFGQTECKRISVMPVDEDQDRSLSVGRPLSGTRVLILGADGGELPVGEIGEIVVTGPHVTGGYWRDPEATARVFRPDPGGAGTRLHTGDYGYLDADGYLYFAGRRDDMFKRKGIRMSTLEIEGAAMDIAGVSAAAALPPAGDRDLAVVVAGDLEPHVVLKELAQRLEPQKVPARCHVVDEVPLTQHGKNSRQALEEMFYGGSR